MMARLLVAGMQVFAVNPAGSQHDQGALAVRFGGGAELAICLHRFISLQRSEVGLSKFHVNLSS